MEGPDTISVTVTRREEVEADKVDVHVTIKGSSLVTGNAALKKAKEVRQLVESLAEVGINEQDIALQGIHAENSSGILGKSTSANYQLRIKCDDLNLLADILGVVTTRKNAKLDTLAWLYPEVENLKKAWLQSCLAETREKANVIASSLNVSLLGVHSFVEIWLDPVEREPYYSSGNQSAQSIRLLVPQVTDQINLGFPLSHTKWVTVQFTTEFRVSEFKTV